MPPNGRHPGLTPWMRFGTRSPLTCPAVHDLRQAEQSTGSVPVVVAGHLHERTDEERDGTRLLTVGSTGATGLGSFTVETSEPYEAQVLRFRDGGLVAIDYLTVEGIGGDFTLERRLVVPAEAG